MDVRWRCAACRGRTDDRGELLLPEVRLGARIKEYWARTNNEERTGSRFQSQTKFKNLVSFSLRTWRCMRSVGTVVQAFRKGGGSRVGFFDN